MRRELYNSGKICNQIGFEPIHDLCYDHAFNKPLIWTETKDFIDPYETELVMVIIDKDELSKEMDEVTDQNTIDLFKKMF